MTPLMIEGKRSRAEGRRSFANSGSDVEEGPLLPDSPPPASTKEILNRLYDMAKPERRLIFMSIVTLIFSSAVSLVIPGLAGHVIDIALEAANGESNGDGTSALTLMLTMFGITAISSYSSYVRTLWLAKAGERLVARVRRQLYAAILSQDAGFFDRTKPGDLLSRLSSDAQLVQTAIQESALNGMKSIVMAIGAATMLIWTSWSLALVSLTVLPPIMTAARVVGRRLRDKQAKVRELHAEATSVAEQALTCITTVQQFAAEAFEVDRYNESVHMAHHEAIETARLRATFMGVTSIVVQGGMICVIGYGGYQVASGKLSAGSLAGFVIYSLMMAGNISGLSNIYVDLMKAVAAANRVLEIVDRSPSIPPPKLSFNPTNETLQNPKYIHSLPNRPLTWNQELQETSPSESSKHPLSIDFQNVSFSYPARPESLVIGPGFSIYIRAGEVLALVGGSGAGKSTFAALLTRLYDASEGIIAIDGKNIRLVDPHVVRNYIGIVSQEPLLFPTSIADNIRYGRQDATDEQVKEAARLANVLEFCNSFPDGLQTVVGPRGTQLSGGQKQRVAVARVFLKDPPIVIFDEATSALDAESEHLVQRAINLAMEGRTVISIAHRLSTIRNANRIAVIDRGTLAEVGTFDDLVNKPNGAFHELVKRQLVTDS